MVSGRCEFWWIKNDQVEALAHVAQLAQGGEYIGLPEFSARRVHPIQGHIARGSGQRRAGTVDRQYRFGAANHGGHAHAAGIAKAIQYISALGQRCRKRTVFALVQVEAGLVAVDHIDCHLQTALGDDDLAAQRRAGNQATAHLQPFECAHIGVRALVHGCATALLLDHARQKFALRLDAGGQQLQHHDIAIAIRDQAGQPVGFGMHQAHRIGMCRQWRPPCQGCGNAFLEEAIVDNLFFAEGNDARHNLRLCAEQRLGEETSIFAVDADHIAGNRIIAGLQGAREYPGMTAQQGFFTPGIDNDFFHPAIVAGRGRDSVSATGPAMNRARIIAACKMSQTKKEPTAPAPTPDRRTGRSAASCCARAASRPGKRARLKHWARSSCCHFQPLTHSTPLKYSSAKRRPLSRSASAWAAPRRILPNPCPTKISSVSKSTRPA